MISVNTTIFRSILFISLIFLVFAFACGGGGGGGGDVSPSTSNENPIAVFDSAKFDSGYVFDD